MSGTELVSAVKVTAQGIRVDRGFEIHDPDVRTAATAAVGRRQSLEDWLPQMVRIGVAACEAAGTRTDLDQLERTLTGLDQRVNKVVDDAVGRLTEHVTRSVDPEANGLAQVSRDSMQRLNDGVTRLVSGSDAVLATNLKALVSGVFADAQQSIHSIVATQAATTQQVLQQDREAMRSSLLHVAERQHSELRAALTDIRQCLTVAESVKQTRSNSSARGTDYELDCLKLIQSIATRSGDLGGVVHTANHPGADGTNVGDITVALNGGAGAPGSVASLVVEAKDRRKSNKPSEKSLTAEARAARSNRKSEVSLILAPAEGMPVPDQLVVFLEANSLCVCWQPGDDEDLVTAAFLMLKMLALSQAAGSTGEVDLNRARRQVAAAETALMKIDEITAHAGKAERAVTLLKQSAAQLRADLLKRLLVLGRTLNGQDTEESDLDTLGAPENGAAGAAA